MAGDNILEILEYKDAKNMIQLPIVDTNHKVLEEASRCVEDSVLLCENPEIQLSEMRTEVFFLMPDFLVDPTDKDLKFLKKNIELNKINFENLCVHLNEFVKLISNLNEYFSNSYLVAFPSISNKIISIYVLIGNSKEPEVKHISSGRPTAFNS